jgi:predicted acetyltransferase
MQVELKLSDAGDAQVLKNLFPLYLHDISAFESIEINRHGVIGADGDDATTPTRPEPAWWKNPEHLFPYLILLDGQPAGFSLVLAGPYLPEELVAQGIQFVIYGFFVLHAYRGTGVAERAAIECMQRHLGQWEIVTYPKSDPNLSFWRRVLNRYTGDSFTEQTLDHVWGPRVAFRFSNA